MALPIHDPLWVFEPFCKQYGKRILVAVVTLFLASLCCCIWISAATESQLSRQASIWLPLFGVFWLGALIGMLVSFYVLEADTFTGKALTSAVTTIMGAGVLALLRWSLDATPLIWFYPMGLVSGFLIGAIWEFTEPRQTEKPSCQRGSG